MRGIVMVERVLRKAVDVRDIYGRVERLHERMGAVDLYAVTDEVRQRHERTARLRAAASRLHQLRLGWGPDGQPAWCGKVIPLETLEAVVRLLDGAEVTP